MFIINFYSIIIAWLKNKKIHTLLILKNISNKLKKMKIEILYMKKNQKRIKKNKNMILILIK